MTKRMLAAAAAIAMTLGCAPGTGTDEAGTIEQAWTIPDSWTCATQTYEAGGARTIGNNSYRIDVGLQSQGQLNIYRPIDVAFDSIATVKGTSISYNWTSTTPIRAIITSAGPGKTTIFDYRPGATSGKGVVANDNVQQLEPIYMLFCFDSPPPVCG